MIAGAVKREPYRETQTVTRQARDVVDDGSKREEEWIGGKME